METMQKAGFTANAGFIDMLLLLTFNSVSQNHSIKILLFLTNQKPFSIFKVNLAEILTRLRGHTQPIHV